MTTTYPSLKFNIGETAEMIKDAVHGFAQAEIAPIAADQTSYRYPSALPGGDYLWRVLIVDRYGNTSGSKEGVFRVP